MSTPKRLLPSLVALGLVACGGGARPPAAPAAASDDHAGAHAPGHVHHGHAHHRFDDAEGWAAVFDDPARDAWQRPDEVIAALALAPDARVADVGAGTGYFAVRLARQVPAGVVHAIDIEPDMVRYLEDRAAREGLANVRAALGAEDDPRIPEPVDVVLLVNTYHHVADRVAYFERLAASLRPGGRLVIVDFTLESPIGPPPEHRLSDAQVIEELGAAGYRLIRRHDLLPHQYVLELAR